MTRPLLMEWTKHVWVNDLPRAKSQLVVCNWLLQGQLYAARYPAFSASIAFANSTRLCSAISS